MAEEDLKKAILERVQREKENILAQANREKEELVKLAQTEASSLKEGYLLEIEKRCSLKKARILNQINLETEKGLLEAKEKNISCALSLVKENLKEIRQDGNQYKSILSSLLQECLMIVRKDIKLKLKVNPLDRRFASEILKELKVDARIETQESIDAGLILQDLEENTAILNIFSSRLEKLIPQLRQEISKILFSE